MIILKLLSYSRGALLVVWVFLCLACPGDAVARDVTLQWDKSIDDPYLLSYKVYYYTTSGDAQSLSPGDYATAYTLQGGDPIVLQPATDPKPITIDKQNSQITLHLKDNSTYYYFVVSAVDTRGLEGVPTAELPQPIHRLTLTKQGTGRGLVNAPPGVNSEINCGTGCASDVADYGRGAVVTLTAAPNAGYAFKGWSGDCVSTGLTCNVTMSAVKNVTAEFRPGSGLTVVKAGGGAGTVTSDPPGINNASLFDYFVTNDPVTLTATPDPGYAFTGWLGCDLVNPDQTCRMSMNAPSRNVTATFLPVLKVSKTSGGAGTITSSPPGISCGTYCQSAQGIYTTGTGVTLAAAAGTGSIFTGWSGCDSVDPDQTCHVAMGAAKNVTAGFVMKGDINLDGAVNLADAILILQVMSRTLPSAIHVIVDTDNDGRLGLADAIYILQKAAGLR